MILDQLFILNKTPKAKSTAQSKDSEKPLRSIVKTISWRVIGTLDTVLISWLVTGHIALALSIGSIELITKMVLYFFHERIWNKIKWGK
ncbi:DUF2061 domain-containing protein [Lutibacter sp. A80]|uniref:DUF2061 domain-containing protein n=1 Tax=Lutibacter sp. A80 TaxID=2918453 RepID=UPI001F06680C|nr:DUF2061 domain-containing protein [Lutibacter sp. A80]UMB60243.1 DUF2061 domain-containing protein [Lutibacter sp. A80]